MQENLSKLNHSIPTEFSGAVLNEARAAADAHLLPDASVLDLRGLSMVTIDEDDARDFDDAVYVEKLARGWRLLVAVADAALYVRPRSGLDREARARGNSCYFPASVEPMLPPALSSGVCSLLPGKDRRVMAVDLRLNESGGVKTSSFYAAVMRSRVRLTYARTQDALDGRTRDILERQSPGTPAMLDAAAELAALLIVARQRRGALDFDMPEAEFTLEAGMVKGLTKRRRLFSHRLIEAFMIAANEAVAVFLTTKGVPFLYRVHPKPDGEKLAGLVCSLRAADLPLPRRIPEGDSSWLAGILDSAAGTKQASLVSRLALRAMPRAGYSEERGEHYGLASRCYCHFTSPVRRYADLVTHRSLRRALGLDSGGPLPAGRRLSAVASICNIRERAAQDAGREIVRRLGCLLLRDRTGKFFRGVISGVARFGLFVELENMPLEGMVRVENLGADRFAYDPDRQELRGLRHGRIYRLGQPMRVRLGAIRPESLEIDLFPADAPA